MKTVLHLSSSSGPGGAERIVCALASSLDRSKYRSLVGLFRPGWLKDQCESRGLVTYVLPSHGFMHWRWMRDCYRLIRDEHVDIIQTHEFDANVHGMAVAQIASVPVVATVHGKHYFWEKTRRRLAYRLVSQRTKMVAVSEDLKRFIVDKVGIEPQRITVIHNGIEPLPVVSTAESEKLKKELMLNEGDWVIGTVGSLYAVKGHRYLLDAMPAVLRRHPATVLILVGRGEEEFALKQQAHRLGIEKQVLFLGLRKDIPQLLSIMDIFVLPSLSEGLSIALLEAMFAARLAVVTSVGGNSEIVVQGETGEIIPASNSLAIGRVINELLTDKDKIVSYGNQGKKLVCERFSLANMVGKYEKLYESSAC